MRNLANSIIQGTEIAKAIIAKRAKRKKQAIRTIQDSTRSLSTPISTAHSSRTGSTAVSDNANNSQQQSGAEKSAEGEATMLLGTGYWNRFFMRRHRHVIRSKPSVKFEVKGAEWCTYKNFSEMYAHIYEAMVEHGIALKCNTTKVKLDKAGEIVVEHSDEAFGLATHYLIQRPDKLIFVDEVGSNTCTTKATKDGHVGEEKFLCRADARPQVKAATKESHFTVLGFTAATGKPVMCAIIFSAKEMCES